MRTAGRREQREPCVEELRRRGPVRGGVGGFVRRLLTSKRGAANNEAQMMKPQPGQTVPPLLQATLGYDLCEQGLGSPRSGPTGTRVELRELPEQRRGDVLFGCDVSRG